MAGEITGGTLAGIIAGVVIGVASLVATICCICTYFPSVQDKCLSFFCCGRFPQRKQSLVLFEKFSQKSQPLKSDKILPLDSVVIINPARLQPQFTPTSTLVHQNEQKVPHSPKEQVKNNLIAAATTNHDNDRKATTILGAIQDEEKKVDTVQRRDIEPVPKTPQPELQLTRDSQLTSAPSLNQKSQLRPEFQVKSASRVKSECKLDTESQLKELFRFQGESQSEPVALTKPPPHIIPFPIYEERGTLKLEQEQRDEKLEDEDAERREMESESEHTEPSDIDSPDEDGENVQIVNAMNTIVEEPVEDPMTKTGDILKSPSQTSLRSIKSVESIKTYGGVILGVDATPNRNGGYCIIRDSDLCEFYSVDTRLLPWRLNNVSRRGNSAEFEMKNLMFALLNWEDVITSSGKLWVYTDNMAIIDKGIGSRQGINVRAFLRHLSKCRQVKIMNNKNHYVHTYKNQKTFTKYILPADHLSRKRIQDFHHHIEEYFPDVLNIKEGFHVSKVEEQITKWIQNNKCNCGFRLRVSNSLRNTIKRRTTLVRYVKTFTRNY